jgi:Sec-independent protein translocase protein TatA
MTRLAHFCEAVFVATIVSLLAQPACSVTCPSLSEAVKEYADFNNPDLGISWFVDRGLKRGEQYGCMAPEDADGSRPKYNFAIGCECANWATCHSVNLGYETGINQRYSSRLGECRCCSWWIIALIVVGCLLLVVFVLKLPRIIKWVQKKWQARRRGVGMQAVDDLDAAEMGSVSGPNPSLGLTGALNASENDRRHSELKRRVARRQPSTVTKSTSTPQPATASETNGTGDADGSLAVVALNSDARSVIDSGSTSSIAPDYRRYAGAHSAFLDPNNERPDS